MATNEELEKRIETLEKRSTTSQRCSAISNEE